MAQRFSIGLSLRGEGRAVVLTPRTIRSALQHIKEASPRLSGAILHQLSHAWLSDPDQSVSAIDRLTSDSKGLLSPIEVARLEAQINGMLIRGAWRLPPLNQSLEHFQQRGIGPSDCRRGLMIAFNGAVFHVEQTPRETLLSSGPRDGFLEDRDRSLRFVRFCGVEPSSDGDGLLVRVANRYRLSQTQTVPLREFHLLRLFTIRSAHPLDGFRIAECSPFLQGH